MKKKKSISYAKWGYIFILPFFITFLIFSLIPLVDTVRYSFYEYYRSGIKEIGPNFIGIAKKIFFAPIRKKVAFLFCKKGAVSRPPFSGKNPRQIHPRQHQRHGGEKAQEIPLFPKPLGKQRRHRAAGGAVQKVKVCVQHFI